MARHRNFQPGGIGQYFDGPIEAGVLIREVHHVSCSHCDGGVEFESQKRMMDHLEMCRGCMRLICLACHYGGKPCLPREKRAEMQENEARLRSRLEITAWRCY